MASEAGGASANGATSSTHVPTSTSAETNTADARLPGKPSTKPSGTLEQHAQNVARGTQQKPETQVDDDEEVEVFGEKLKRSDYQRIKKEAEQRREHTRAANARFEEAAKVRKASEQREAQIQRALEQFKTNPAMLFEAAGINHNEWAEKQLTKAIQRQQMSPEQVELERIRAENEQLRSEHTKAQETAKKQKFDQETQRWFAHFDKAIGTALESGNIPRTPRTADRVRQVFADLVDAGHQIDDSTGALALEIARDGMMTETSELLGQVAKESPQALVELLGGLDGDIVKTIQRLAVQRHEQTAPKPKPQVRVAPKPQSKMPPTMEEVRAQLDAKFNRSAS